VYKKAKEKMENVARNYPVITTKQDWPTSVLKIKMISAQHTSNNGKNRQKLSYQKILLAW